MAVTFGGIGAKSAGGTTTTNVDYPASVNAGSLLILGDIGWLSTAGVNAISGWTVRQQSGGTGSSADAHTTTAASFYKEAAGGESGSVTVTRATATGQLGIMAQYDRTGPSWDSIVQVSGTDNSHGANRSITTGTVALAPGDMLNLVWAVDTDAALTVSCGVSASGITFGTPQRRTSGVGVVDGPDGNIEVFDVEVLSGTGTVAITATLTTATSTCGGCVVTRMREAPPSLTRDQSDLATSWNVLARDTSSTTTAWNVAERVASTAATSWHVAERVALNVPQSWNVLTRAASTLATSWHVRARAAATLPTSWNVAQRISSSSAQSWHVRARVGTSVATSWNLAQRIATTLVTEWNVADGGGLTRVASTLSTTWHVLARGQADTPTGWNVRRRDTTASATSWHVRARVSSATPTSWNVAQRLASTLAQAWHVRARVTADPTATSWNVRARTSTSTSTSWNVRARVAAAVASSWRVLERRLTELATSWNVLPEAAEGDGSAVDGGILTVTLPSSKLTPTIPTTTLALTIPASTLTPTIPTTRIEVTMSGTLHVGDTAPRFTAALTSQAAPDAPEVPINLTGAGVELHFRKPDRTVVTLAATHNGAGGVVTGAAWGSILDQAGDWEVEAEVTYSDSTEQTVGLAGFKVEPSLA